MELFPDERPEVLRDEDKDVIQGLGVTVGAMRYIARRQLVGSIVVLALIIAVAGLAALHPNHRDSAFATAKTTRSAQHRSL
jgi:hypothetical protein